MLVVDYDESVVPGARNLDGTLDGFVRARSRDQLAAVIPLPPNMASIYAVHVELCAAAMCNNSYANYIATINRVLWNLQTNGAHIISRHPVTRVCSLSHKRLHADTAHAQRDEEVERRVKDLERRVDEAAAAAEKLATSVETEEALQCPKCFQRCIIYRTMAQLRHGDEGMQTQCQCSLCKAKWMD
jgi:DNA-directed RNA polymerase subunit M/transcription elongation factor TFIIS